MQTSLDKGNDPGEIELQCEMYVDTSTSMHARFDSKGFRRKGESEMEGCVKRNLGLLLTGLDPDGQLPVYAFDSTIRSIGIATEHNYQDLLNKWLNKNHLVPATRFMPILAQVTANYEQAKAEGGAHPRLIIVHTDGVAADAYSVKQALGAMSDKPIFWIFIGHGQDLSYLRDVDTNGVGEVDNVALIELKDASSLTDEEYYDKLVHELIVDWLPEVRRRQIVKN